MSRQADEARGRRRHAEWGTERKSRCGLSEPTPVHLTAPSWGRPAQPATWERSG